MMWWFPGGGPRVSPGITRNVARVGSDFSVAKGCHSLTQERKALRSPSAPPAFSCRLTRLALRPFQRLTPYRNVSHRSCSPSIAMPSTFTPVRMREAGA